MRIPQVLDYPSLQLDVDRFRAAQDAFFAARQAANSAVDAEFVARRLESAAA